MLSAKKKAKPNVLKQQTEAKDVSNLATMADSRNKGSGKSDAERAKRTTNDMIQSYAETTTEPQAETSEEADIAADTLITEKNTPIELQRKLKTLTRMIENKNFTQARRLLKRLQKKYPDYDFSAFMAQIQQ